MKRLVLAAIVFATVIVRAGNEVDVPFAKYSKKITLTPTTGPCSADEKNKFTVEVEVAESSYKVNCKVVDANGTFNGSVSVTVLENFKQKMIISDIKSHAPDSVQSKGVKAIHAVPRRWGMQYWWSDERFGSTLRSYLCPKKEKTCYRVVYGGIEMFEFDITSI